MDGDHRSTHTTAYSQSAVANAPNSRAKVQIINHIERPSGNTTTYTSEKGESFPSGFFQSPLAIGPNSKAKVQIINYERKFLFNSAGEGKSPLYTPTQYEQKLKGFFASKESSENIRYALIHGIAGSGKTTLAQFYLTYFLNQDPGNRFVYLLNVETFDDYQNSLRGLAEGLLGVKELKIVLEGLSSEAQTKAISDIIKDGLSKRTWALVLDNLEDDAAKILEHFEDLFNSFSQGHVLITTQHDGTIKANAFPLDLSLGLQNFEAKDLIGKILNNLPNGVRVPLGNESELQTLIEEVDRLPLALALAGHYLWHENAIRLKVTFMQYIELLRKEAKSIEKEQAKKLAKETGVPRDNKKEEFKVVKTQHAAIRLSIRKAINLDEKENLDLLRVLCLCGFLPSDRISLQVLLRYGNTLNAIDEEDLGDIFLKKVSAYSLLQLEKTKSVVDNESLRHIHRTVQKVLRQEFWPVLCSKLLESSPIAELAHKETTAPLQKVMNTEMGKFGGVFGTIIHDSDEKKKHFVMRELIPQLKELLVNYLLIFSKDRIAEEDGFIYADFLYLLGNAYFKVGEFVSSKEYLLQSVAIKRKIYEIQPSKENHLSLAKALKVLGRVHSFLFDHHKQKEYLKESHEIYERYFEKDDKKIGKMLGYLASAYGYLENYDTQLDFLIQAHKIIESKCKKDGIDIARISVRLGNAYAPKGNPEKQYELLNFALPIYKEFYGERHPQVGMLLHFISYACMGLAEKNKNPKFLTEAQKFIRNSLEIMQEFYGKNSLQYTQVFVTLAMTHGGLNDFGKMRRCLEYSLPILGQYFGESHSEYVRTNINLAKAYRKLKLLKEAEKILNASLVTLSKDKKASEQLFVEVVSELYDHERNPYLSKVECDLEINKRLLDFRLTRLNKEDEKITCLQKKIGELEEKLRGTKTLLSSAMK